MNPSRILCPLLVIVLAACIHEGLGVRCWDCYSETESKCADPFDNSTVKITYCDLVAGPIPLPNGQKMVCSKSRLQVNGQVKIERGCHLPNPAIPEAGKSCTTSTAKNGAVMELCTCNTDGCNKF